MKIAFKNKEKILKLTILGFTLVELLAVIVILAIVLAIAVPSITGIIENVTINAFEQDAKMIIKSINYKSLTNDN
ncbi:MAG: prepilin-type N-terminal cleavage/methylation domain-containing protein, partial [Bacilli bacterium]|nr:prepilin-type N-terminal cleavage/methylation domain-containing protein [Bacilli bacterium]